jgi:tetraacyldisaccharide 4'-kinase
MERNKNILLYPVSFIYGLITGFRNFLFNSGILSSMEFHLPIICVGNITVGGTGKTPHTEYIAELLKERFKVATLSRGYKRKTRDFRIASASALVSDIGDEPMQMFRKLPGVVVSVDRDRVHGVNSLLRDRPEVEVIILDDAYQHRRIKPGLSILLSGFERPVWKDHMLPYGNLREKRANMKRADVILITKCPENLSVDQMGHVVKGIDKKSEQKLFFTTLNYKTPIPVFETGHVLAEPEISGCSGCGIVLITGIANPEPLKDHLKKSFNEIIHLPFPDHYNFNEHDLLRIASAYNDLKSGTRYLFTTEKDAVRFRELTNVTEPLRSKFYYVPVEIRFLNKDKDQFDNLIIDYVRKNHRNSRIS